EGLGFASTCLRNSRRLRDAEVLPVPTTSQPPREKVEKRPDEVKRPSARQLGISTDSRSEPKKETASNRMAIGAVIHCTRMPVRPGPVTPAMDSVKANLALPSRMFSRPTSDGRYAW